ncbi:hypothetical protein HYT51_02975 [Candidatus Woesearchaeota archaeon]|nr:hypothetical protein [Candidatus Woesearchaeota archaeon]
MRIFEVKDKYGRNIYLTEERRKHILKHPEMQDKLTFERMKETLVLPDIIIPDKHIRDKYAYYKYYKDQRRYLLISVKYLNGEGFIITIFYTDDAK